MFLNYPTEEGLEKFRDLLHEMDFQYLPPLDEYWVKDMYSMFQLVRILPRCDKNFAEAAANVFFKVIKNHVRYDGNKRSAICCLLFFSVLNNRKIITTVQKIEELALDVASSLGNSGVQLIPLLSDFFDKNQEEILFD